MNIWFLHEQLNGRLKPNSAVVKLECHTDQWLSLDLKLTFNAPSQQTHIKSGSIREKPDKVLVVLVNAKGFIKIKMFKVLVLL